MSKNQMLSFLLDLLSQRAKQILEFGLQFSNLLRLGLIRALGLCRRDAV